MNAPNTALTISLHRSMAELEPAEWNALASGGSPFLRWEWLNLLETSGSVAPETGWMPVHLAARQDGCLVAAAPLYVKVHGEAEFVYDHLWADVAARMDIPYYPKLVAASPFTPVAGYRFLLAPDFDAAALTGALLRAMERLCQANGLSGRHVLFAHDSFAAQLEHAGYHVWEHQGFLWENEGFSSFDVFLALLRSGQRKNIRRERRTLAESGVRVEVRAGQDVPESWWGLMHRYYQDTNEKFGQWGCKHLTAAFFEGLAWAAPDNLALCAAFAPGSPDPIGLSLLAHGGDTVYGRYWGAGQEHPFLHFELCYYTPMEWCIAGGWRYFDPGMGGEHKPRRGFRSRTTKSLHRFEDPRLETVFTRYIGQINSLTQEHIDAMNAMTAFKHPDSAQS